MWSCSTDLFNCFALHCLLTCHKVISTLSMGMKYVEKSGSFGDSFEMAGLEYNYL